MPIPLLGAIAPVAGLLGRIFGAGGGGAANQRITENDQRLRAAQMANQDALQRAQLQSSHGMNSAALDLNRRQFQQNEPTVQAGQAVRGSLINRLQPLQLSGLSSRVQQSMPRMNSIIDALGPEARQAGALLAQRGLSGLESGGTQFEPIAPLNLPPAQLAALQKSGLLEKILGAGGLIGSTVGALGDLTSVGGKPRTNDPYANRTPPYVEEDV
jgi:hypothetical protein